MLIPAPKQGTNKKSPPRLSTDRSGAPPQRSKNDRTSRPLLHSAACNALISSSTCTSTDYTLFESPGCELLIGRTGSSADQRCVVRRRRQKKLGGQKMASAIILGHFIFRRFPRRTPPPPRSHSLWLDPTRPDLKPSKPNLGTCNSSSSQPSESVNSPARPLKNPFELQV